MNPILELKNASKYFGSACALENISLNLYPGEVLALLGDNGAGKSTLVKILSGVHKPDTGELIIRNKKKPFPRYNVRTARALGVETVHQECSLGEKQSLWRNIFIGRHLTNRFGFIRMAEEKKITRDILTHHLGLTGVGLNETATVKNLSGGERQGLTIGRAMYFRSDIVILDEPTTALSLKEANKVLTFIRKIKERGCSCILITHNIHHAQLVSDRFVIMDRGRIVKELKKEALAETDLSSIMIEIANEPI